MEMSPAYIYGLHPDVYRTGETAAVIACLAYKDKVKNATVPYLKVRFADGEIAYVSLVYVFAGRYRLSDGNFYQDQYNMWHHRRTTDLDKVGEALEEACAFFRNNGDAVAMFWWRGVCTPIMPGDTPNPLFIRWSRANKESKRKHT